MSTFFVHNLKNSNALSKLLVCDRPHESDAKLLVSVAYNQCQGLLLHYLR